MGRSLKRRSGTEIRKRAERLAAALLSGATLLAALPVHAAAPPRRSPEQRQMLIDLSYSLGEVHALRLACMPGEGQGWRARMSNLIAVEAPDEAFKRRLIASFNAGFVSRKAEFPLCREGAQAQERAAAARGRDIARRLSSRAP